VFFRNAVRDQISVQTLNHITVQTGCFGPFAAGFQDGSYSFRRCHIGGVRFEFRGSPDIPNAPGDERHDLTIDSVHSGADFLKAGALLRRDLIFHAGVAI
jgi:hypothetical protein